MIPFLVLDPQQHSLVWSLGTMDAIARYKYVRPLDLYRSAVNIWPAITHRAVSWWSGLVSDGALAVHTLLMGCSAHIQFHAKRFRTKFKTSFIHIQHHHFCFLLCTTDHHPHSIRDLLFYRRRPNDPFHSNVMLCCITAPCLLSIHPTILSNNAGGLHEVTISNHTPQTSNLTIYYVHTWRLIRPCMHPVVVVVGDCSASRGGGWCRPEPYLPIR